MRKGVFYTLDDYDITYDGNIVNKHNGHVLKGRSNSKGYLRVCIGKKFYFIHRLVAEKYVPNPDNKEQVNHKDGNKLNNTADNLEWVNNQENRNHAVKDFLHLQGEDCPYAKLNWEAVDYIRANPDRLTQKELGDMFGVARTTISSIVNYRTWKHKPEN
jgi:hypothetical protein